MKRLNLVEQLNRPWLRWTVLGGVAIAASAASPYWWPRLDQWIDTTVASRREASRSTEPEGNSNSASDAHGDSEDGHHHGSGSVGASLELSAQALKNLGLTEEYLKPVVLSDYYRTITIPAIIVSKPGRTEIQVSSPMIGIVQHVHAVSGEAVVPGDLLFEVRLTYEDLVETQTQLIKSLADLEVERREFERLEEVTRTGAVASKLLLERQYALEKLQSSIAAQRAALKLHGLSDEQVDRIVNEQRLLRDLRIEAPETDRHEHEDEQLRLSERDVLPASFDDTDPNPGALQNQPASSHPLDTTPLIVERLSVSKGQGVQAGEMLCALSDYSTLYIEGKAFEQDAGMVAQIAANGWPVEASIVGLNGVETVSELSLAFVANAVDPESRTLSFFVNLPNTILRDETTPEGQRFVTWKYRIGQRLEVRIPVEAWKQQIVLPVDAAVKEGADWFVFQQNGDHFDRVAVHVKYRDQRFVVIENDGAIFPGDVVALRSAHQMQMAIKNQAGAGVDPHAGHNH